MEISLRDFVGRQGKQRHFAACSSWEEQASMASGRRAWASLQWHRTRNWNDDRLINPVVSEKMEEMEAGQGPCAM